MDNLQTEENSFVRRYKWLLIAFVIGFTLIGALGSLSTWRDFARHPSDTVTNMISYSVQIGFWSGLIGGLASAVVAFLFIAAKEMKNKLLK